MTPVTPLFAPLPALAELLGQDLAELTAWVRASRRAGVFPVPINARGRVEYFRAPDFRRWRDSLAARHGATPTAIAS